MKGTDNLNTADAVIGVSQLGEVHRSSAQKKADSPSAAEPKAVAAGGENVSAATASVKQIESAIIAGEQDNAQEGEADLRLGDMQRRKQPATKWFNGHNRQPAMQIQKENWGLPPTCLTDMPMVATGPKTYKQALQSNEKEMICIKIISVHKVGMHLLTIDKNANGRW